ncbi:glycosyltransferase family 2 protein [Empedobacter stercoris]|uniref:glycosyltransferase family 2 protein n=1 Tax=Empedobacter stercoris TaxID=1628248 RepID=UPI001CE21CEB|nr:glycosyltransferase [Empedobacter stercoris]MCA4777322.1 glycosyltransferase [Empedobacter stercoris]
MNNLNKTPIVSVIMSVYNAEKYLEKAIKSILTQTFDNFEFIIINDASTDDSLNIIHSFLDDRIRLIEKEKNKGFKGFVENLNLGLDLAKGKYIARMDADDIAHPTRFKKQINFLEHKPHIFMVGSSMDLIDESDNYIKKLSAVKDHQSIVKRFNYDNPMYHPALMYRRTEIRYRDVFRGCEDFDFHLQHLSKGLKFENIEESLIKYRILENSISRSDHKISKLIALECARDSFVLRENSNINSDFDVEVKFDIRNSQFTKEERMYNLNVALRYNSPIYSELLTFYQLNFLRYKIFKQPLLRKLYSKLILRFQPKIK